MLLRVPALAADNGFLLARFLSDRKVEPMIPQNGQIQVGDECAIRRVSEDVIHAGRFEKLAQGGGIAGERFEVLPAINRLRPALFCPVVVAKVEDLFLGLKHVLKSPGESAPDRKFDTLGRQLVTVDAEDAGTTAAGLAALGRKPGLVEFRDRRGPG